MVEPCVCFDKLSPPKHSGLPHTKQPDIYLGKGKNIAHFLFSILASMPMIQASEHELMLNKPKKQMFIATLRTSPSICCNPRGGLWGMVGQGRVPKKKSSSPRETGQRSIGRAQITHRLSHWFSAGGQFSPKETSGNVWRHFRCHKLDRVLLA